MSIEARVKKLEYFLSKKARKYPNWLLIYNNVASFKLIEEYFPYDNKVWGNGSIIITTRNSNVKPNNFIPETNIIELTQLTKLEKKQLFSNIIKPRLISKEDSFDNLIDKIPSYPLDIFHVTSFIKEKGISCEDYMKYLSSNNDDFTEIRKQIVIRSIEQILDKKPHFTTPLILVNSISNTYISKDFLEFTSKGELFSQEMKKLGLIEEKTFDETGYTIHPIVQQIALTKLKKMDFYNEASIEASELLNNYINLHVNKNNMDGIQNTIAYIEPFLLNNPNSISKANAELHMKLADSFFDIGSYKKAKKYFTQAEQIYTKFYSDLHPKMAKLNERMGIFYRNVGDYEKARKHLESALNSYSRIYSESNIKVGKAYLYLGSIYRNLLELDKAFTYTIKGYNIIHSIDTAPPVELAKSDAYLGIIYTNLGKYDLAQNLLEQTLDKYKNLYQDNHTKTAWLKTRLTILYRETGRIEEAQTLILEAQNTYQDFCGENSIEYAWRQSHLGIINKILGNHKKGNNLIRTSIGIFQKHYNTQHNTISWAKKHLAGI